MTSSSSSLNNWDKPRFFITIPTASATAFWKSAAPKRTPRGSSSSSSFSPPCSTFCLSASPFTTGRELKRGRVLFCRCPWRALISAQVTFFRVGGVVEEPGAACPRLNGLEFEVVVFALGFALVVGPFVAAGFPGVVSVSIAFGAAAAVLRRSHLSPLHLGLAIL